MKTSSNYGLKLMEGTDNVKRQDFVDNFTAIDTEMKNIENKTNLYGVASGTNTYTVSITGVTSYYDGLKVTVKIGTASTGASTLNINGLGAKTILDNLGNAITSGGLKAGIPYNLCYNGTNFIVLGKGGGGNATADKILNGYTATVDSGQVAGTMANNGAISGSLNAGQSKVIPKGYTDGGTITANSLASQTAGNATAAQILAGYKAWVNGVLLNGGMVNRGAVSATLNAGGSYTIPAGYHNGSGKITANSLASQSALKVYTSGPIDTSDVSSKTFYYYTSNGTLTSKSAVYIELKNVGFIPKYGIVYKKMASGNDFSGTGVLVNGEYFCTIGNGNSLCKFPLNNNSTNMSLTASLIKLPVATGGNSANPIYAILFG